MESDTFSEILPKEKGACYFDKAYDSSLYCMKLYCMCCMKHPIYVIKKI